MPERGPSRDDWAQFKREMEELKRKVEKLERVEIPPEREEAGPDGYRPNPNRGSTIPHIDTPDAEAATPTTKTIERAANGWRLLDADEATDVDFEDGDFTVYLKSAANTGGVPEIRYTSRSPGGGGLDDGKGADGGRAYWFKGPLEMYDVNAPAQTVKFYGTSRLTGSNNSLATWKGVWKAVGNSSASLDTETTITTGTWFWVKGTRTGSNPPYGMTYTFEKRTTPAGFPAGDDETEIFPCWYVDVAVTDEGTIVDLASIERWLACVRDSGIS